MAIVGAGVIGASWSALFLAKGLEVVATDVDADTALSWGPGLRRGVMGSLLLNHLGGGQGGIEHFFEQFAAPMRIRTSPLQ